MRYQGSRAASSRDFDWKVRIIRSGSSHSWTLEMLIASFDEVVTPLPSLQGDHGHQAGGEPGSCVIRVGVTAEVPLSAEVIGCTG